MSKFINPFTDFGFKLIFGSEISKEIIIAFLNSLLDEQIVDISFRNVEALGIKRDARKAVFDIFCQTDRDEFIIVEMQQAWQKHFTDRVLFYASFPIQWQTMLLKERDEIRRQAIEDDSPDKWDYQIRKVYVICMLNFVIDKEHAEKYRWDVVRMDRELKEPFSETLNEVYLEMPKFKLPLEKCDTLYKKFLYILKNIDIMERLPDELNEQIFRRLKSLVEVERMSLDERLAYELDLAAYRDIINIRNSHYELGKEEGREEGLKEGLAQADKKLKAQMHETAKGLKSLGLCLKEIAQVTKLSEKEIQAL